MKLCDIRDLSTFKDQNWKPITSEIVEVDYEFPEGYWISNKGVVISYRNKEEGMILKPMVQNNTYKVAFVVSGRSKVSAVHRLVLKAFGEQRSDTKKLRALIINGDPNDIRLDNLKWVTRSEFCSGIYSRNSFYYKRAERIAELLATEQYTISTIAKMTKCTPSRVSSIKAGHTWTKLYDKYDLAHKDIPKGKDRI